MGTSAIESMMSMLSTPPSGGLLGAPGPLPAALTTQMHAPPPPNASAKPAGGMMDRIHARLSGMLDSVRPSAPQGYEGLLSSEEIDHANPGIGARLAAMTPGAPTAGEAYRGNLDSLVKMHGIAAGMAEQRRVMGARQRMADLFPAAPNESQEAMNTRLEAMYAYAVQHGDLEMAKHIGDVVKETTKVPKEKRFENVGGAGLFDVRDPDHPHMVEGSAIPRPPVMGSPEWKAAEQFRASLVPHPEPLVQVEGPDGPVWMPRNQAAGMPVKKAGMAGSAQNMATEALLRSSTSEMTNADQYMREFEERLANGTASINGVSQFLGGLGNAFTHDDPASRAIQNTALTGLNKTNPDLARYIRRGLSFAEGEAGISKRPSDFRTKMATFLSTAASGASPEMVRDIQGRRHSILSPLTQIMNANPVGGSHSKGSGSATGALSYEDWKKMKGHK